MIFSTNNDDSRLILGFTLGVVMVHTQYGFFMNWQGSQAGEGFGYHLLAIGIALALTVWGAKLSRKH